jgi:tetratricopeptide (TPR) repeat protein
VRRLYNIRKNWRSKSDVFSIRSENANNFKSQGNEYFQGKRYREAASFYTQGIDANPTDNRLMEALLCNRAACSLELSANCLALNLNALHSHGIMPRKFWFCTQGLL